MKTYIHTDGRLIYEDELKELTLPKVGERLMFKGDNFFRIGQNAGDFVKIIGTHPITIEDDRGSIGYISLEEFASAFEPTDNTDYAARAKEQLQSLISPGSDHPKPHDRRIHRQPNPSRKTTMTQKDFEDLIAMMAIILATIIGAIGIFVYIIF